MEIEHLMTDIETVDTKPTGVILSIAMVEFDPWDNTRNRTVFMRHISMTAQVAHGRTRSANTALWWMDQEYEAQRRMLEGQQGAATDLTSIADTVQNIVSVYPNIWANGPDFDYAFLQNFVQQFATNPGRWPFWKHRCVRTMKNIYAQHTVNAVPLVAHDPVEDCLYQIRQVQDVMQATVPNPYTETLPSL
jgi:hypothetical protein